MTQAGLIQKDLSTGETSRLSHRPSEMQFHSSEPSAGQFLHNPGPAQEPSKNNRCHIPSPARIETETAPSSSQFRQKILIFPKLSTLRRPILHIHPAMVQNIRYTVLDRISLRLPPQQKIMQLLRTIPRNILLTPRNRYNTAGRIPIPPSGLLSLAMADLNQRNTIEPIGQKNLSILPKVGKMISPHTLPSRSIALKIPIDSN